MAPGPFCCYNASTLRYMTHLLPITATHNPLLPSKGSTPLLASFLAHLNKDGIPVPTSVPEGTSPLFYAIIQVKKTHSLDQTETGIEKPESVLSPTLSSMSIVSFPAATPTPTFNTQPLAPQNPSNNHPSTTKNSSTIPLPSARYFVPIEKSNSPTALHPTSLLFSRGFREISTQKAMDCLRFPEMDVLIGDGEIWTQLEGMERFYCVAHGVGWELRVWVKGVCLGWEELEA